MRLSNKFLPLTRTWCPLCSKSTAVYVDGPLWPVEDIPIGEITIPNLTKLDFIDLFVCERCCKRRGLIW